jgi:hypothetical protein
MSHEMQDPLAGLDFDPDEIPGAWTLPGSVGVPDRGGPGSCEHGRWMVDRLARRYLRYMADAWVASVVGPENEDWLDQPEGRLSALVRRLESRTVHTTPRMRYPVLPLVMERVHQILNPQSF